MQFFQQLYSDCANNMRKSAIREVLKLTQQPNLISFAGGLPSPKTFPVQEIKEIIDEVLQEDGPAAFQYCLTEGYPKLREALIHRFKDNGVNLATNNLAITTASQQGLDLLAKIFINPGDNVLCELPSYLGGISAFSSYGANLHGIPFDENGLDLEKMEAIIKDLSSNGATPKLFYTIPDFQNPTGNTISKEDRLRVIELAHQYNFIILEDSPYREIRFEGEPIPTFYELDPNSHVVNLGSFSKIFIPGFRLGWMVGHEAIIDKFVMAKQSADLCSSVFNQKIATKYLSKGLLEKNLKNTISLYHRKRDIMLEAFENQMPDYVKWTRPEGGLFLFVYLPEEMDAAELFHKAVEQNVAFVQGDVFFCDGKGKNTMRINFSFSSEEDIIEGVARLANVIKTEHSAFIPTL